ncbi:MAG: ABC transporter permease [Bacilli bacterium]
MKNNVFRNIYLLVIFIFMYLPIFVLMLYSFNESRNQYIFTDFSLKWYTEILSNQMLVDAIKTTFKIAILSTTISVIIGFSCGVGIMFLNNRYKKILITINQIPLINPDIVTGVGLMLLFIFIRVELGFSSMLIAHIAFSIPYVVISILPRLNSLGIDLINAGMDLGLKPRKVLSKIILPAVWPNIVTGALIAFTMSIDDFVISYFVTGNGINNLSIWIFSQTKKGINPTANAISSLMFVFIITLLMIYYARQNRKEKTYEV